MTDIAAVRSATPLAISALPFVRDDVP